MVIHVPRADYNMRPVYVGENPYKGTYKRNHEGGYRKDRRTGVEGLTMAGLLMFGKGLIVRDEFDNIFMDYRDESAKTSEIRWNDRVTYDGTWENNLFSMQTMLRMEEKLQNSPAADS